MEFLKAETTHVVVMFDGERRKHKQVVDLVPRSWLTCFEKDIIFCSYPPKEDYDRVNEWTKQMLNPNPGWKKDRVTVRKEAVGYEQGMRRLSRAYSQCNVESTDAEARSGSTDDVEPLVLSDSEIQHQLDAESFSLAKKPSKRKVLSSAKSSNPAALGILPEQRGNSENVPDNKIEETALRKCLEEMEKRFIKKVDGLKRSILYDLNLKLDQLKATVTFNHPVESRNITKNREILGFQLPITTLKEFLRFDLELEKEDNKKGALKSLMEILAAGTDNPSDDLGKIFSATIHKDVQLLYSAVGRKMNGVGKKNFSETSFYKLLQDVMLAKHEKITAPALISKLSRFLSGATDRNNGRRNRGVAEPIIVAEPQAALETGPHAGLEVNLETIPRTGPETGLETGPHTVQETVPEMEVGHCTGSEAIPESRPCTDLTASLEVGSQAGLKDALEPEIASSDDDSEN